MLYIKGPATHELLGGDERRSSDVDILVRPQHLDRLVAAFAEHGWTLSTSFAEGSPFEHAANYIHEQWGYADIHRHFPGVGVDAADAFEILWRQRERKDIAHHTCWVPDLTAQRLVLLLHAARAAAPPDGNPDVQKAWGDASDTDRRAVRALADRLGATAALCMATGDPVPEDQRHTVQLLDAVSSGDPVRVWVARWHNQPSLLAKVQFAVRSLTINRQFLEMQLGRPPTLWDRLAAQTNRVTAALAWVRGRVWGRPHDGRHD